MDTIKVVFCSYSSLYSSLVLRELLSAESIQVTGIVNSTRVLKKKYGFIRGAGAMLRTSGLPYVLKQMCVTDVFHMLQPVARLKSVESIARRAGIALHNTRDINDAASAGFVRSCNPDILITAYFNQRVLQPLLSLPRLGGINIHPSLLPRYRGTDPVFQALYRHESEIGVTVHRMDEQFDTGPILRQLKMPVQAGKSLFHHYTQLFARGARLACIAARHLAEGGDGYSQTGDGGYDGWPSSNDVRLFCRSGGKLIALKEFGEAIRLSPSIHWTEGNESPRV